MQPSNVLATIQSYIAEAIAYNKVVYYPDDGVGPFDQETIDVIEAEAALAGYHIDFVMLHTINIDPTDVGFVHMWNKDTNSLVAPYYLVNFSGYTKDVMESIKANFELPVVVRKLGIAVDGNLDKAFFFGYFA